MKAILKQKFNKDSGLDSRKTEAIMAFIDQIERGEVPQFGAGNFKTAYEKDGEIYLRESKESLTYKKASKFYKDQQFARMLKDNGIAIADLIFHTVRKVDKSNLAEYLVMEKMEGKPLDKFKDGPMDASQGAAILKERAIYGQKFMPKFFRDFTFLCNTDIIWDRNGENYLFDRNKGYSFIDIDFDDAADKFHSFEQMQDYIQTHSAFNYEESLARKTTSFLDDIYREPTYDEFISLILKPLVLGSDISSKELPFRRDFTNRDFEAYAYRGIIFEQFKQMFRTYAREFGIEKSENVESLIATTPSAKGNIFLPLPILQQISELFEAGKETSPELAAAINAQMKSAPQFPYLSHNFNFANAINPEEFRQAMDTLTNPNLDFGFLSRSAPEDDCTL